MYKNIYIKYRETCLESCQIPVKMNIMSVAWHIPLCQVVTLCVSPWINDSDEHWASLFFLFLHIKLFSFQKYFHIYTSSMILHWKHTRHYCINASGNLHVFRLNFNVSQRDNDNIARALPETLIRVWYIQEMGSWRVEKVRNIYTLSHILLLNYEDMCRKVAAGEIIFIFFKYYFLLYVILQNWLYTPVFFSLP